MRNIIANLYMVPVKMMSRIGSTRQNVCFYVGLRKVWSVGCGLHVSSTENT